MNDGPSPNQTLKQNFLEKAIGYWQLATSMLVFAIVWLQALREFKYQKKSNANGQKLMAKSSRQ